MHAQISVWRCDYVQLRYDNFGCLRTYLARARTQKLQRQQLFKVPYCALFVEHTQIAIQMQLVHKG